jgi:hypothetical protein
MTIKSTILNTAAIATLAAAPLTPAIAQSADTQGSEVMEEAQIQFSDSQLESFAEAVTRVLALRQSYQARIADVTDAAEQQALVQQAQQEMVTAVEETDGITVETYNEIGLAAQENAALNDRIIALLQEQAVPDGG